MIVRVHHIRNAQICMKGARTWFERHDLSWDDFLDHGLPLEQVEAIEDALAQRVAEAARQEMNNGR